jgi:hypothetical protein
MKAGEGVMGSVDKERGVCYISPMDFEKLKKLAAETNGLVIMNGETPELVVLPYKDYQELLHGPAKEEGSKENIEEVLQKEQEHDDQLIESLNQEIEALRDKMTETEQVVDL